MRWTRAVRRHVHHQGRRHWGLWHDWRSYGHWQHWRGWRGGCCGRRWRWHWHLNSTELALRPLSAQGQLPFLQPLGAATPRSCQVATQATGDAAAPVVQAQKDARVVDRVLAGVQRRDPAKAPADPQGLLDRESSRRFCPWWHVAEHDHGRATVAEALLPEVVETARRVAPSVACSWPDSWSQRRQVRVWAGPSLVQAHVRRPLPTRVLQLHPVQLHQPRRDPRPLPRKVCKGSRLQPRRTRHHDAGTQRLGASARRDSYNLCN